MHFDRGDDWFWNELVKRVFWFEAEAIEAFGSCSLNVGSSFLRATAALI
jgi:hypothetical protein